jgi:hypothetical protein
MGRHKKDIELLSAYIDGELSKPQEESLERKIKSSLKLQKQLDDLIKLKNLTSLVKRIPESPFFETRLMTELESTESGKGKLFKWSPAISLVLIILSVMALLKFNPGFIESIWEEQKSNLAGFYKENLQPLLFAADLTNEDIFSFAFNNDLPLDQERKQYLFLGYDKNGKEYFEIKNAGFIERGDDYNSFIKTLNLNKDQKLKVDSILGKYAEGLQSQILINDKHTVAINSNLWNYRKAIAADLIVFAQDLNNEESQKLMPVWFSKTERVKIVKAINSLNSVPNKNYIFLTPDSVFTEIYEFDPAELNEHMIDVELQINEAEKNIKKIEYRIRYDSTWKKLDEKKFRSHEFNIKIDSNVCRVVIPEFEMSEFDLPDFDSIETLIDEATENVRFYSYRIPKVEHFGHGFKIEYFDGDSVKSYEYEYENYDYDSLLKSNQIFIDSINSNSWEEFEDLNDSTITKFKFDFDESFKNFNHEQLEEQMEKLREELEQFREEMQQWQNEIRKEKREIKIN